MGEKMEGKLRRRDVPLYLSVINRTMEYEEQ
jgi:hypothetical protein